MPTDKERLRAITQKDRQLNDWAFRSFRDVGDGDYIAARMAYRAQLPMQFLWSCQQALEKYLKCALFIRRIAARKATHDLAPLLKLLEDSGSALNLSERSRDFIRRIDGVAQYRYMEASVFVDWSWIVSLDQAVWEIRRFCTLDPAATGAQLPADGKWPPRVPIVAGQLEKIIRNRSNPARAPLLWHNAYFGRKRRSVWVRGGMSAINSPLLRSAALLDAIQQYAYVPKAVAKAYRESDGS